MKAPKVEAQTACSSIQSIVNTQKSHHLLPDTSRGGHGKGQRTQMFLNNTIPLFYFLTSMNGQWPSEANCSKTTLIKTELKNKNLKNLIDFFYSEI